MTPDNMATWQRQPGHCHRIALDLAVSTLDQHLSIGNAGRPLIIDWFDQASVFFSWAQGALAPRTDNVQRISTGGKGRISDPADGQGLGVVFSYASLITRLARTLLVIACFQL